MESSLPNPLATTFCLRVIFATSAVDELAETVRRARVEDDGSDE
jgi:hypothetical protein